MNAKTDDELLSAYIDGELSLRDSEHLTARLAAEPDLAERLAALRSADDAMRALYASLDERPLPAGVRALLDETDPPAADNVVSMPAPAPERRFGAPLALAASVALLLGVLVGNFFSGAQAPVPTGTQYAGQVDRQSGLYRLLESGPGAQELTVDAAGSGRVVLTFESTDGEYCRQFRLDRDAESLEGLACRREDGWHLDTVSFGPGAGPGYQAASGTVDPAVAAAVDARIGDAEPLDSQAESALISSGWKKRSE